MRRPYRRTSGDQLADGRRITRPTGETDGLAVARLHQVQSTHRKLGSGAGPEPNRSLLLPFGRNHSGSTTRRGLGQGQPATAETTRTRVAGSSQSLRAKTMRPVDQARNGNATNTESSQAGIRASPEKIRLVSVVQTASRAE